MKKAISFLLALVLWIFPLLGHADPVDRLLEKAASFHPAQESDKSSPAGDWYLTRLVYMGSDINPAALQTSITLTLHADGTVDMLANYEEDAGTWLLNENQVDISDTTGFVLSCRWEEDRLIADYDGVGFIFSKDPADTPPLVAISDPVPADDVSRFNGQWGSAFLIDSSTGFQIPLAFAGYTSHFSIRDGYAEWGMNDNLVSLSCRLSDGALVYSDDTTTLEITLRDNDLLACLINNVETVYYVREAT